MKVILLGGRKQIILLYFILCIFYLVAISPIFFKLRSVFGILLPMAIILPLILFKYEAKKKWNYILLIQPIFIFLFLLIFIPSPKGWMQFINSSLIFLAPISSIILYKNDYTRKHLNKIILLFCLSIVALSVLFLWYFNYTIPIHDYDRSTYRNYIEQHFDFHGTYLSLFFSVSYFILLDTLYRIKLNTFQKIIYIILIFNLLLDLMIINSRAVLSAVSIVTLFYTFRYIRNKNKLTKIILFIIVFIILNILLYRSIYDFKYYIIEGNVVNSSRYGLYNSAFILLKEGAFFIRTPEELQESLNIIYEKNGYSNFGGENLIGYNIHNQYLNFLLLGSFPLLLSFMVILIYKLWLCIKHRDLLYFSIVFMFAVVCFSENILSRQYGIYLWAICDLFFFGSVWREKTNKTIQTN